MPDAYRRQGTEKTRWADVVVVPVEVRVCYGLSDLDKRGKADSSDWPHTGDQFSNARLIADIADFEGKTVLHRTPVDFYPFGTGTYPIDDDAHRPPRVGAGFVTAVVPHAKIMDEARRWAGLILECSPMSIRATKQVVMRSLDVPALEMAMRNLSYPAFVALTTSEDTVEGPKAFAEKRKPNWKGR